MIIISKSVLEGRLEKPETGIETGIGTRTGTGTGIGTNEKRNLYKNRDNIYLNLR